MSAGNRDGQAAQAAPPLPCSPGLVLLGEAVSLVRSEWSTTVWDVARLASLRALWPQVCALYGHVTERIGDVHMSGAAVADGFASTTAFLRTRLCVDNQHAVRLVRVSVGLLHLPAVRMALFEGRISVEHADAIRQVAVDLGDEVMAGGELERILLDYAYRKPPADGRRLGRLIRVHLASDEEAEERQVRLHEGRWLTATTTFNGMVHVEAMLDPIVGAAFLAALAAYTPGPDRDRLRTPRQRRADGLEDIVAVALANKDRSVTGEEETNAVVTVSLETLRYGHRGQPHPAADTDHVPHAHAEPASGSGPEAGCRDRTRRDRRHNGE